MKIAIVTVYEPITNLGSYLQCFALKTYLEDLGHKVDIIGNVPLRKQIKKYVLKINPKRAFFLRFKKICHTIKDISRLDVVYKNVWNSSSYDVVVYGSDEIWNVKTPVFTHTHFF